MQFHNLFGLHKILDQPDLASASDWFKQISHMPTTNEKHYGTQISVVTHHQSGISALVSQTSYHRETSGDVAKCWLFSQASTQPKMIKVAPFSHRMPVSSPAV